MYQTQAGGTHRSDSAWLPSPSHPSLSQREGEREGGRWRRERGREGGGGGREGIKRGERGRGGRGVERVSVSKESVRKRWTERGRDGGRKEGGGTEE